MFLMPFYAAGPFMICRYLKRKTINQFTLVKSVLIYFNFTPSSVQTKHSTDSEILREV